MATHLPGDRHTRPLTPDSVVVGRYRLIRLLARRDGRETWLAEDTVLQGAVVLKLVDQNATLREQRSLVEELALMRRLRHPHLSRALDLHGTCPTSPSHPLLCFTQTWHEGPSLSQLCGQLSPDEIRTCLLDMLEVLTFLQHHGLTRLDLKPDHLIRSPGGWCLVDLGQARHHDPLSDAELHGSLPWLAPEMLGGGTGSPQADLYSLGAALREAIPGTHWQHQHPDVAHLLSQLLAHDPTQRPETALVALTTLDPLRAKTWRHRCPLPETPLVDPMGIAVQLHHALGELASARGGVCRVVGPPSSGRSRHLEDLADFSSLAGHDVLRLAASSLPSAPWAGASCVLRWLESRAGGRTSTRLEMAVASRVGASSGLDIHRHGWLTRLLALAQHSWERNKRILVLMIDDFELLDPPSQALLEQMVLHLPQRGLCVFAALSAPAEGDPGCSTEPKPRTILEGGREMGEPSTHSSRLDLSPWGKEEVRQHAETVLGPGTLFSAGEVDKLHLSSLGRPGLVREILTLKWIDPTSEGEPVPPGDAPSRLSRLEKHLSVAALEKLRPLAILEGTFTLEEWAEILKGEATTLPIGEVVGAGVLERAPSSTPRESRWRFASEPTRRALEASLSPAARVKAHRHMLAYLQERALDFPVPALRLAQHFRQSEQPEGTRATLQRALEETLAEGALEDAISVVKRLLDLHPPPSRARCGLLARQADLLLNLRKFAEAEEVFLEALEQHQGPVDNRRVLWLAGLGRAQVHRGKWREATDTLEQATELHVRLGDAPQERLPWYHLLAWLDCEAGQLDRARRRLLLSRQCAPAPNSALWVEQEYLEVMILDRLGSPPPSILPQLEVALTTAGRIRDERAELKLTSLRASLHRRQGQPDQAVMDLEWVCQRAHQNFALDYEAASSGNLGEVLRDLGRWEPAVRAYTRAAELYHRLGNPRREALNHLEAARVLAHLGRREPARRLLELARRLAQSLADTTLLGELDSALREQEALGIPSSTPPDQPTRLHLASRLLTYVQHVLLQAQDERSVAAGLADMIGTVVGGRCLMFLLEQGTPVIVQGHAEVMGQARAISRTILKEVISSTMPYRMADVSNLTGESRFESLRDTGIRSVVCLPLLRGTECVGAIYVDHPRVGGVTGDDTTELLEQMKRLAIQLLDDLIRRPPPQVGPGHFSSIGTSASMRALATRLERLVTVDTLPSVMFLGETGVGKSWLARQLHLARGGSPGSFVTVNCGAVAESIFEAEFFGATHYDVSGKSVVGYFDLAEGGTLFLDEIGDLPYPLQAKLLTVLSEREFMVVGSKQRRRVQCDLIFATNRDLHHMVSRGTFRQDLLERIQDVSYWIPSLRERGPEDIRWLAEVYLTRTAGGQKGDLNTLLSPAAIRYLGLYSWPGNVRQLEKLLCSNPDITATVKAGLRVDVQMLEDALTLDDRAGVSGGRGILPMGLFDLPPGLEMGEVRNRLDQLKGWYTTRELSSHGGNKSEAARSLKVSRSNLDSLLKLWPGDHH